MLSRFDLDLLDGLVDAFQSATTDPERVSALGRIESMHTSPEVAALRLPPPNVLYEMRQRYAQLLYERELLASASVRLEDFEKWSAYSLRWSAEVAGATLLLRRHIASVIHLGCGGMPVTAILAAQEGRRVTLIDRSTAALEAASGIFARLGLQAEFIEHDLLASPLNRTADLAVLAGTVGITEVEKRALLERLAAGQRKPSCVCVRQPVREELLLMACLPDDCGFDRSVLTWQEEGDYLRRDYILLSECSRQDATWSST